MIVPLITRTMEPSEDETVILRRSRTGDKIREVKATSTTSNDIHSGRLNGIDAAHQTRKAGVVLRLDSGLFE
jgi:hypothetical protein